MRTEQIGQVTLPDLDALAEMPGTHVGWSPEEDALILAYYGKGAITPRDMSQALEARFGFRRTPDAVMKRAYKLRQQGVMVTRYGRAA